jgi:hypothetical protein
VPENRFDERSFSLVISHLFYGGKDSRSDGALIFVLKLRGSTICFQKMKTAVVVGLQLNFLMIFRLVRGVMEMLFY